MTAIYPTPLARLLQAAIDETRARLARLDEDLPKCQRLDCLFCHDPLDATNRDETGMACRNCAEFERDEPSDADWSEYGR